MSSIASLYNVPDPKSPGELGVWSFAHMAHHRDIIRRIYELSFIALPEYPLDPVNPSDTSGWTDLHQQMHTDMDAILGISGFNLNDLDWNDQSSLAGWIQNNASEHYQAADILRIG